MLCFAKNKNIDLYTAAANLFYLNGIPSDGQIALAAGDYIDGLTKMWGEAFTSSEWWAYAITTLGQASINPSMTITPRNSKQLLDKYFVKWQEIRKNFPTQTIKNIDNQWFKLGYVVRDNWKGYKNIFRANLDEIAEAKIKIKKHRDLQGGGDKGNYGYLEGKIGNIVKKGEMVRSGEPDKIKQIFIAEKVNSQQEIEGVGAWLRTTDSEYKLLNRLANELGAERGKVYRNVIGELKIVSERAYCPSCQGVIQQFNEMFPNVKIILIDGVK